MSPISTLKIFQGKKGSFFSSPCQPVASKLVVGAPVTLELRLTQTSHRKHKEGLKKQRATFPYFLPEKHPHIIIQTLVTSEK